MSRQFSAFLPSLLLANFESVDSVEGDLERADPGPAAGLASCGCSGCCCCAEEIGTVAAGLVACERRSCRDTEVEVEAAEDDAERCWFVCVGRWCLWPDESRRRPLLALSFA